MIRKFSIGDRVRKTKVRTYKPRPTMIVTSVRETIQGIVYGCKTDRQIKYFPNNRQYVNEDKLMLIAKLEQI